MDLQILTVAFPEISADQPFELNHAARDFGFYDI